MTETTKLSAFEKLLRIQAKSNARQCQCGSHLEGECPECDETSEETESTPVIEEEEKGVNPPEKKKEQCPTCQKWFVRLKRHRCGDKDDQIPTNEVQSRHVKEPEKENDQSTLTTESMMMNVQSSPKKETRPKNDQASKVTESENENDKSLPKKESILRNDQSSLGKEPNPPNDKLLGSTDSKKENVKIDLYINILMEKGSLDAIPLTEFLKPVTDAICKENEVDHWRNLPFGKAKGTLAVRTWRFLQLQKKSINIYVPPWCLEWEAVADVLREYATNVFVGVR
jgi:hypothetical protein